MVEYTPEEINIIIKLLKIVRPADLKIEKTIRYLEQRHKFFNPTRDILTYIIKHGDKFKLDPELLLKMKTDLNSRE